MSQILPSAAIYPVPFRDLAERQPFIDPPHFISGNGEDLIGGQIYKEWNDLHDTDKTNLYMNFKTNYNLYSIDAEIENDWLSVAKWE